MATIIAVTFLPSLLLFYYIYTHDEHPEPKNLIIKVVFAGALASIPVLLIVLPLKLLGVPSNKLHAALYIAFVLAAIPEEFFKFTSFYSTIKNNYAFDEPFDGIIYGVAASLGFATLENILYVSTGGLQTAINRSYTAVPLHAFAGVIMGYFVGKAYFTRSWVKRKTLFIKALLYPIIFHGSYDAAIFYSGFTGNHSIMAGALGILIVEVVWGISLMKNLEQNNIYILAEYYNINPNVLASYLSKGESSENILPQILSSDNQEGIIEPNEFSDTFPEDKQNLPIIKQHRRTRGFLGFIYALIGIFVFIAGVLATIGITKDPAKDLIYPNRNLLNIYIIASIFSFVFIALNGLILFLKGVRRNREQPKKRSFIFKILLFLSFFMTMSSLGNITTIIKKSKTIEEVKQLGHSWFIVLAISLLVWLISLFAKRKQTS